MTILDFHCQELKDKESKFSWYIIVLSSFASMIGMQFRRIN